MGAGNEVDGNATGVGIAKRGVELMDMLRTEYKGVVLAAEAADAVWNSVAQLGGLSRSATQSLKTQVNTPVDHTLT